MRDAQGDGRWWWGGGESQGLLAGGAPSTSVSLVYHKRFFVSGVEL